MSKTRSAEAWLLDGARSANSPGAVLQQLCERLVACGVPLDRGAVFIQTLHPDILGRSFTWKPGEDIAVRAPPNDFVDTGEYRNSPIAVVKAGGGAIRRRLCDATCQRDFPVLHELAQEGFTDYIAAPLHFSSGEMHCATWATKAPDGFAPEDIAGLAATTLVLTRIAEIWALRRVASNLLDTYVGHHAGERVLAGKIRRGDSEQIEAVIWLADLRGFTAVADQTTPECLLELLNRYYDCLVPAIAEHGGEVLKFMGDGMLAIFPTQPGAGGAASACASALAAVDAARSSLGKVMPEQGYGIALHIGPVVYGNIGSAGRLDFTCIGPAVNLTARLEKLTAELRYSVLASATLARHAPHRFVSLGDVPLRGFDRPLPVFGLKQARAEARQSALRSD